MLESLCVLPDLFDLFVCGVTYLTADAFLLLDQILETLHHSVEFSWDGTLLAVVGIVCLVLHS